MNSFTLTDEAARRAYWTQQMERGYALAQEIWAAPVHECGEAFASIPDAAAAANVEMQFSTTKIASVLDRVYFMRESLARDVVAIGKAMNERGWILRIEDAFRTVEMQRQLARTPAVFDAILRKCQWECDGRMPSQELFARRASVLVANAPKTGTHMSGSAVDVSVFDRDTGSEVWRGYPYLEMSEHTPMRSPFIEEGDLQNRLVITAVMEAHGFIHFPFEFWHYNKGDALAHHLTNDPRPARYGAVHWDARTNQVTPVADPLALLNPLPVLDAQPRY